MKKNNYQILNQKYSISQLRACKEYLALIGADADLKESLQNNLQKILDSTDINKADGFLLDNIGALVGTSRGYFDVSVYFKINSDDVNTEKYIWFSEPQTDFIAPSGSLEDRNFRARIRAKAGANISKCTREANINIIKNMTFAEKVIIKNVAPMLLDITIKGSNLFISQDLKGDIESILGRGVGIRNLVVER
jgi:hypothetical protein